MDNRKRSTFMLQKINVFAKNFKIIKNESVCNSERKKKIIKKPFLRLTGGSKKKKKLRSCNCKNSKCLKLYCECF